jgi:signal transduction histidine kinase/pSer/pThr/pTyr-binding forkhead associated (FHA) protein
MELELISGPGQGRRVGVQPPATLVLGREPGSDLHLSDEEVSRRHCRLAIRDGRVLLTDLGSRNGTLVNGHRVTEIVVRDGDEIQVGKTRMRVRGGQGEASASGAIRLDNSDRTILISLDHREADILGGGARAAAPTPEETVHENAVLREICHVSQVVAGGRNRDEVLAAVLDRLHEVLKADTACLLECSEPGADWAVAAASARSAAGGAVQISRTIAGEAAREGTAILSTDPLADGRFAASSSIVNQKISSAVCSPLKVGGRYSGVLFVDRRAQARVFGAMDLRLVASVANILSLFMEKLQAEQESRRKARMAVIGEVVAGLAHYIKNIVTGFRLSIDAMQSAVRERRMDYVESFAQSIAVQEARISELMLNMLSYAKEREPVRERIRLQDEIAGVAEPYLAQFEKEGIRFELLCDDATPDIHGEEISIHRVFLNLVTNARDAVNRRSGQDAKLIRVSLAPGADGASVEAVVYDTGTGIPADRVARVFEAFYSTKGAGGTGLGLAVVRKIVREHGGSVEVTSEEGAWTRFKVVLPAAGDDVPGAATA